MWTFYFRSLLWSSHERRDYKTGVEAKLSQKSILNQKEQFCDLGQFMQYFIEWIKTFFFFLVHPHPQHNEKVHFAKSFPTFGLSSPKQTQNKKNFFCTTFREHSKQIENFPRSSSAASDKIVLLIFFFAPSCVIKIRFPHRNCESVQQYVLSLWFIKRTLSTFQDWGEGGKEELPRSEDEVVDCFLLRYVLLSLTFDSQDSDATRQLMLTVQF